MGGSGPQLLDQGSLSTLRYPGWMETPTVDGFSHWQYRRYCALLHR